MSTTIVTTEHKSGTTLRRGQPLEELDQTQKLNCLHELPSPIRRFNEIDLQVSSSCADTRCLQSLCNSVLQRDRPIDSAINLAPTKTQIGARIQQQREHEDEVMALSPFKTPRSGDNSLSPQKPVIMHEENLLSSTSSKRQEQRFLVPTLHFNLISSIINPDMVNLPDTSSSKTSRLTMQSHESQRYLFDSALHQSSSKCLSPIKRSILGCCTNAYSQSRSGAISRNFKQSDLPRKVTSTLKTIEECNDVDEYLDESRHRLSLTKRLNINVFGMSPGGRVLSNGNLWSRQQVIEEVESNPEEEEMSMIESNHYMQVVNALKVIKCYLKAPSLKQLQPLM